jgi:hypothetical protein
VLVPVSCAPATRSAKRAHMAACTPLRLLAPPQRLTRLPRVRAPHAHVCAARPCRTW